MKADTIVSELTGTLRSGGAALVGFADMHEVPADARLGLPRAVSIAVALNPAIIAGIIGGPTAEYYGEYMRANALLDALGASAAGILQRHGCQAQAASATTSHYDRITLVTRLPHKTAATRAGLGWIGKCALLVTTDFGPAVRLTTVLTDAPLPCGQPVNDSGCGACDACVEVCPGHAPSGRQWRLGLARADFFDAFACEKAAHSLALQRTGIDHTFCGMCIAACPWTQAYIRQAM